MMNAKTLANIVTFLLLYIAVFLLLAKMGVYVAFVGAFLVTKWLMK